jgi:hypothetical protein|tara:strand:+ start:1080 stop:1250 length:171 start_codon:yes stop_codon:yes gene_type:complete
MSDTPQQRYSKSSKGKKSRSRAQKKYDDKDKEGRRVQKREYMRRKRANDPSYCKWK